MCTCCTPGARHREPVLQQLRESVVVVMRCAVSGWLTATMDSVFRVTSLPGHCRVRQPEPNRNSAKVGGQAFQDPDLKWHSNQNRYEPDSASMGQPDYG